MNDIPVSFQQQVGSMFRVSAVGIAKMRKRQVKIGNDVVKFWLEIPPAKSKYVLKAHLLVAGVEIQKGFSQFEKLPINTSNGSRVTYSFTSWAEVEVFLKRLPSRMPSNAVTELRGTDNTELNAAWLFYKIDLNWGDLTVRHNPFPPMRKLQQDLRSVGIAA
jgi:hypothetical protein